MNKKPRKAAMHNPRVLPHLDPLTQVLDGVRLRCIVPSTHEMTAPWGVRFASPSAAEVREHAQVLGVEPPRDLPTVCGAIVAILRGSCCLEVEQHDVKLPLSGGDVVLITRKDPYILRDDWRTPAKNVHSLLRREHLEHLSGLRYGGGGVPTTFLSGGFVSEDDEEHPLLLALPPVICIRPSESEAAPWLESTLKFLGSELDARPPGSQSIVNHLAHVLFVQAVRAYAASMPEDSPANWCHGIYDSELAPVLGLMHLHPEEPWTVASLADQACISRSAFAARFMSVIGRPPLKYLTECRMRKARAILRDTNLGVKAIAAKVGYSNESAFSNAFKRETGVSPAAYRHSSAMPHHSPGSKVP